MSKFVSLSYFDLAEMFRKSMFSIHRNKTMNLDKGSDRLIMLLITGCSIL